MAGQLSIAGFLLLLRFVPVHKFHENNYLLKGTGRKLQSTVVGQLKMSYLLNCICHDFKADLSILGGTFFYQNLQAVLD